MFDIIREIWHNPGPTYSPIPFWFWNDTLDAGNWCASSMRSTARGSTAS